MRVLQLIAGDDRCGTKRRDAAGCGGLLACVRSDEYPQPRHCHRASVSVWPAHSSTANALQSE